MDDTRFDQLTRLFGQGASRRTLIKGFLGIGGAAAAGSVVADQAGARDARTRPTIPEPPPPATTTSSTTTPAPCPPGEEQCPNSTVCCPAGTCARSGNQAICCTGHVCGRECCVATDQYRFPSYACCDRECCAADHTCLTRVFPEGPNVEEEMCCPAHLACDNQCCDGACFDPIQGPVWYEETEEFFLNGHPVRVAQTSCCPEGNTVCRVDFSDWQCCSGDTPKCCPVDGTLETPGACRAETACCDAADCTADNPGTDASCWACNAGSCVPILNDGICGENQICCDLVCCAAGQMCVAAPNGEVGPAQESHVCITPTTTTTLPPGCPPFKASNGVECVHPCAENFCCCEEPCELDSAPGECAADAAGNAHCVIGSDDGLCFDCFSDNDCEANVGAGYVCFRRVIPSCDGGFGVCLLNPENCEPPQPTTTTTTTTLPPCPAGERCGSICCSADAPYCLDAASEYCGECLSSNDCGGNHCCSNTCCDTGDICLDTGTASEVSAAAIGGCCSPDSCPAGNLGDQCGTFTETCLTQITCECTSGTCGSAGLCCLPDGPASTCTNHNQCCNGSCSSYGYCGCINEGNWCVVGVDTCCAGGTYPCTAGQCIMY
ncbi:MAG: hypothetical protein KF883_00155 [Thermomicrobiales bacterium]|nr:hypothetical protein [Thermomicrobiales bacterium]